MDEPISFPCESCHRPVVFPAARRGHVEECPHCAAFLDVPSASTCPAPPAVLPSPLPAGVWWELAAVICLAVLPSLYFSSFDWYWGINGTPYLFDDAVSRILSALRTAVPILVLLRLTGQDWRQFGLVRPSWWLDGFITLVVWTAGRVIPVLLLLLVAPTASALPRNDPVPQGVVEYLLLWASYVAGAFEEELVMRGYLLTRLRQLTRSSICAIVLTSVLFGLLHLHRGLTGVVLTTGSGLVYGIGYCLTRRLWPVVIAHALHNILVTVN